MLLVARQIESGGPRASHPSPSPKHAQKERVRFRHLSSLCTLCEPRRVSQTARTRHADAQSADSRLQIELREAFTGSNVGHLIELRSVVSGSNTCRTHLDCVGREFNVHIGLVIMILTVCLRGVYCRRQRLATDSSALALDTLWTEAALPGPARTRRPS